MRTFRRKTSASRKVTQAFLIHAALRIKVSFCNCMNYELANVCLSFFLIGNLYLFYFAQFRSTLMISDIFLRSSYKLFIAVCEIICMLIYSFLECDQKVLSRKESSGYVYSPNYPYIYLPNTLCKYYIYGLQDNQNLERVKLIFEMFDIPSNDSE